MPLGDISKEEPASSVLRKCFAIEIGSAIVGTGLCPGQPRGRVPHHHRSDVAEASYTGHSPQADAPVSQISECENITQL